MLQVPTSFVISNALELSSSMSSICQLALTHPVDYLLSISELESHKHGTSMIIVANKMMPESQKILKLSRKSWAAPLRTSIPIGLLSKGWRLWHSRVVRQDTQNSDYMSDMEEEAHYGLTRKKRPF